jgi:hypothetical protein
MQGFFFRNARAHAGAIARLSDVGNQTIKNNQTRRVDGWLDGRI